MVMVMVFFTFAVNALVRAHTHTYIHTSVYQIKVIKINENWLITEEKKNFFVLR